MPELHGKIQRKNMLYQQFLKTQDKEKLKMFKPLWGTGTLVSPVS